MKSSRARRSASLPDGFCAFTISAQRTLFNLQPLCSPRKPAPLLWSSLLWTNGFWQRRAAKASSSLNYSDRNAVANFPSSKRLRDVSDEQERTEARDVRFFYGRPR